MKEYKGKSLEELRFEDYQANRKTAQRTSAFGSSTGTGRLGSTAQPATTINCGAIPTTTGLGGSKLFGATTTATPTTTGLFGASAQPALSILLFFGAPAPFTSFGGYPAAAHTTSTTTGLFGASAQPAQVNSSFFGAPATTAATTISFGGFGSTTTQPATTSVFGQTTAKPSIFGGLGQTAAAPTTGLFGSTSTTTAPATTGSIFGQVYFFDIYIPLLFESLWNR
jgi:nuclear pore complex protein Nup98-Nup96